MGGNSSSIYGYRLNEEEFSFLGEEETLFFLENVGLEELEIRIISSDENGKKKVVLGVSSGGDLPPPREVKEKLSLFSPNLLLDKKPALY